MPEICSICRRLTFACGHQLPSHFVLEVVQIRQAARDICEASVCDLVTVMNDTEYAHLELLASMMTGFGDQVRTAAENRRADRIAEEFGF